MEGRLGGWRGDFNLFYSRETSPLSTDAIPNNTTMQSERVSHFLLTSLHTRYPTRYLLIIKILFFICIFIWFSAHYVMSINSSGTMKPLAQSYSIPLSLSSFRSCPSGLCISRNRSEACSMYRLDRWPYKHAFQMILCKAGEG